jgi:hypothetical protein
MERRKYPRFELKVDAKYSLADTADIKAVNKTVNISAEGLCFESEVLLKNGTLVELEVELGDDSLPVKLSGEIRWSQEIKAPGMAKKKFLNDIKLLNLPKSDEGRFLKYYCGKMVEKLSAYLRV